MGSFFSFPLTPLSIFYIFNYQFSRMKGGAKMEHEGVIKKVLMLSILTGLLTILVVFTSAVNSEAKTTLIVYNPTGAFEVSQLHAPRLPDLRGKTICELSNGGWEDHRILPAIRELLAKQFPDAKFIPLDEFPIGTENIDKDSTIDMLVKKGCQAIITGMAG